MNLDQFLRDKFILAGFDEFNLDLETDYSEKSADSKIISIPLFFMRSNAQSLWLVQVQKINKDRWRCQPF